MLRTINLYEAKTRLSTLVDEAAAGEEIIIAKNGVPKARLVPAATVSERRKPSGLLKFTYVADDFDEVDPELVKLFEGS